MDIGADVNARNPATKVKVDAAQANARSDLTKAKAERLREAGRRSTAAMLSAVSSAKVEAGVEAFGSKTKLASYLGVSKTQPTRWIAGKESPKPHTSRLVKDVDYVWDRIRTDMGADTAKIWLHSSNPFLHDSTPLEWLKLHGPGEVIAAFDAAEAGSYA